MLTRLSAGTQDLQIGDTTYRLTHNGRYWRVCYINGEHPPGHINHWPAFPTLAEAVEILTQFPRSGDSGPLEPELWGDEIDPRLTEPESRLGI